jgi:hypothetical protein
MRWLLVSGGRETVGRSFDIHERIGVALGGYEDEARGGAKVREEAACCAGAPPPFHIKKECIS